MKIRLIPVNARRWGDVIQLHDEMIFLMKYARKEGAAVIRKYIQGLKRRSCANCGNETTIEIHHIKPVWVYALEVILSLPVESKEDRRLLVKMVTDNKEKILVCNNISNFMPVCKYCHTALGKVTDQTWKEQFEAKYRVIFGIRRVTEVEKLFAE